MRKTTFKQSVHGDNEALSNTNEYAYRRGVHQALGMLQFFLEDNFPRQYREKAGIVQRSRHCSIGVLVR